MLSEKSFPAAELRLNYVTGPPSGPPLVFLHGVTRRWQDFLTFLPSFAWRWQVHGLDFRGHGRSERCPGRYLVVDYVRDAVSFLDSELTQPAVLYGHSLGALVAIAAAAQRPEKVRAVVLEDPPAPVLVREIRRTPFHALFTGFRHLLSQEHDVLALSRNLAELTLPANGGGNVRLGQIRDATSLRFTARSLLHMDPEVLSPLIEGRWLEGYPVEQSCRGVRCPVLLLRADETFGGMLPPRDAEQLAAWMSDCTVIHAPGVGHLLHWLQPETTTRHVTGFLEAL
jgi:pimeloyl-ACP methyl ester carboxylesterase